MRITPGILCINDPEAYEILATPRQRPWISNGALPREPRLWERSAERSEQAGSATRAARRDAKPVRPTTAAGVSIDVTSGLSRVTNREREAIAEARSTGRKKRG